MKDTEFELLALLGARTLLGAPGIATRSKGIATRNKKLLGAPGLTTRSKDSRTLLTIYCCMFFELSSLFHPLPL